MFAKNVPPRLSTINDCAIGSKYAVVLVLVVLDGPPSIGLVSDVAVRSARTPLTVVIVCCLVSRIPALVKIVDALDVFASSIIEKSIAPAVILFSGILNEQSTVPTCSGGMLMK